MAGDGRAAGGEKEVFRGTAAACGHKGTDRGSGAVL